MKQLQRKNKGQLPNRRSKPTATVLVCIASLCVSLPLVAQDILDFIPAIVSAANNDNSLFVRDAQGNSCTLTINQKTILDLHNQVRQSGQQCGGSNFPAVSALRWSCTIGDTAFSHSNEMRANGDLSHRGNNGSNAGSRLNSNGYRWSSWGENIAAGRTSPSGTMAQWLGSTFHCANLMDPAYEEIGVAQDSSIGNYWTAVFANPQ